MKKTYIVPAAKSINLSFEGLVASSPLGTSEREANPNLTGLSNRRNSIWMNDEEESVGTMF